MNHKMSHASSTRRTATDKQQQAWQTHGANNPTKSLDARQQFKKRFVLRASEVSDRAQAGGKAFALASVSESFDEVPAWFVITPAAFEASLDTTSRLSKMGGRGSRRAVAEPARVQKNPSATSEASAASATNEKS